MLACLFSRNLDSAAAGLIGSKTRVAVLEQGLLASALDGAFEMNRCLAPRAESRANLSFFHLLKTFMMNYTGDNSGAEPVRL